MQKKFAEWANLFSGEIFVKIVAYTVTRTFILRTQFIFVAIYAAWFG
jgi:hypothetical protein